MERFKKNIIVLCISILLIIGVTFSSRFVNNVDKLWIKIIILVCLNLLNGFIAYLSMRITQMNLNINYKNWRQYLIGAGIALALSLVIAVIPAICGFSLVGGHTDFSWFSIIYNFLFYLLVIGPVEEFIFRVYLQDTFTSFFLKHKWIGVIIASALFGFWHLINGSIIQVVFTFGIGLVFGFAKYKIKDCDYFGISLSHGLYDFLNVIVRMFIV